MKFLKKNWLRIIIVMGIISASLILIGVLDIYLANKDYEENIENLEIDVERLESVNKSIRGINDDLRAVRAEDKAAVDKAITDLKSNQKRELARIGIERDEWKAKVKDMPPSVVVIEIRAALKTDEVWERPDGILFSLVAARDCLAILGDFSLVAERDQWKADYDEAMSIIKDKDNTLALDEEIFIGLDDINFNLEEIIEKKDEKFRLSEKRNRVMYWKGIKAGGLVLGILGFIGGFVLGK